MAGERPTPRGRSQGEAPHSPEGTGRRSRGSRKGAGRATKRVLVVEDEAALGQVLADALADEGYEVRWATNGQAALDLLAVWVPDLIVLDLMMPVMDGWAFRRVQQGLPGPVARIPLLVLSGARDTLTQARALGAQAAIAKPFDLDHLLQTVRRLLQTSSAS